MDRLSLHIEYLLTRNDCVILPGIGAFLNAYMPAHFDEESGIWSPMSSEIRFNQAINQDDGLMANSYSRKYSLSFHDARALLDSDIKYLLELAAQDGEVSIGRLGTLKPTENNSWLFSPYISSRNSRKELGLILVSIRKSEKESEIKPYIAENIDMKAEDKMMEHTSRKFDTDRNYYIPVNKVFAKVACSILAVCLISVLVILNTDSRIGEDKASVIPVKEIVDTTASLAKITGSKSQTSNPVCNPEISAISDNSESEISKTSADIQSPKQFHLIVGTFSSEKEAQKYVSYIGESNVNLEILPSKTLWRVSIASSDDKTELISKLNSREISGSFEGAWIYEVKSGR